MATSPQTLFSSSFPEVYERFLVAPLFRPFAQALLDRAHLTRDDRLLDVACGTGIVARLAREVIGERGRVVGIDVSPAMVGMAKSVAPSIEWREGDATHLPAAGDDTFTVVTCHQGVQFFPDKPSAVREMRRVLAPGGRLAIAAWRSADDIPIMRDLQRIAEKHLGPIVDRRHSFGDAETIRALLTEAGFGAIAIETVTLPVRMSDATVFPQLNAMALMGMSTAAKAMGEEERSRVAAVITTESIEAARPYLVGPAIVFDLASTIATGRV
jgi:ubiquinone/menaquinone biosynthesis C-methylase UbiE